MPAMLLPHGCEGLRVRRMTVWWTFRRPFMGRPVPRQLLRNALLDLTTIVPATAYHRRSYAERYSRFIPGNGNRERGTVHAGCHTRAALIRFRHAAMLLCQQRVPGGRPGYDFSLEGNRLRLYRTFSIMAARLAIPMHRVCLRRQEGMA